MPSGPTPPDDPAELIAAALARLRGRRGPRPPWAGGPFDEGHGHGHGGPHGRQPEGARGWGGPHGHRGGPPWAVGSHARFGAGPARLRLLDALASADSLTVSQIAEAVGVDQPRATRLVQQSVELGLVRREADPDDARRTRVVLTDEGRAILQGFRGERRQAIQTALQDFTDSERAELARLLTKLAEAWPST